jgi:hypothetical protein
VLQTALRFDQQLARTLGMTQTRDDFLVLVADRTRQFGESEGLRGRLATHCEFGVADDEPSLVARPGFGP